MKGIFLMLLLVLRASAWAQGPTIFLFEEFVRGKIHFKNHSVTMASINPDVGQDRMLFMRDGEIMEITNTAMIDSISVGNRLFVPLKNIYLEKINASHGIIFIHWKVKETNIGSKGAFGMPTQGKVETLNNYDFGLPTKSYTSYDKQREKSMEMFRRRNMNTYYIEWNDGLKEITSLKQLIKLFPDKKDKIHQYVSEKKLEMKNTTDAIELIDYCLSL